MVDIALAAPTLMKTGSFAAGVQPSGYNAAGTSDEGEHPK